MTPGDRHHAHDLPPRRSMPAAAGLSAARTLIEQSLGWLAGFPDPDRPPRGWVRLHPPETDAVRTLEVDREGLHEAVRSLRRLHRDFPRALPRLVGDADAWAAAVEARLEDLKVAVHGRGTIPPRGERGSLDAGSGAERRLRTRHPGLGPAIDAANWAFVVPTDQRRLCLRVLERNAASLERLAAGIATDDREPDSNDRAATAILAVLQLVFIGLHVKPREIASLVDVAASGYGPPALPPSVLDTGPPVVRDLAGRMHRLFAEGHAWTRRPELPWPGTAWLTGLAARVQSNAASVAATARTFRAGRVAELLAWRSTVCGLQVATESPLWRAARDVGPWGDVAPMELPGTAPAHRTGWPLALRATSGSGAGDDPRLDAGLPAVLQPLPPAEALTLLDALTVADDGYRFQDPLDFPTPTPAGWKRVLRAVRPAAAGILATVPDSGERRALLRTLGGVARSAAACDTPGTTGAAAVEAFDALVRDDPHAFAAACARDEFHIFEIEPRRLLDVVRCIDDPLQAGRCWLTMQRARCESAAFAPDFLDTVAVTLAEGEPRKVGSIGEALLNLAGSSHLDEDDLERGWNAVAGFVGDDARTLARLLDSAHRGRLRDLVAMAAHTTARASKGATRRPRPVVDARNATSPDWAAGWPADLQAAVARLAAVRPDAEHVSEAARQDVMPDADRLQREHAEILRRLDAAPPARRAAMRRRAASLEARMAEPEQLGPAAARRLLRRLESLADSATLDAIEAALLEAAARIVASNVGADRTPDVLALPGVMDLVGPIASLPTGTRQLAFRVLARWAGSPRTDLRGEGPNRSFLERMARVGIDVLPWLEGTPPMERTIGGQTVCYQLEHDPLELMRMGQPFGTCLAPGRFNFFSAIVNAADVNKQVIFARIDDRIVGRCLLAMTDEGRIQRFHAYAHEHHDEHRQAFAEFALALGEMTGGGVATAGTASPLMWREWYDDGPAGFDEAIPCIRPDSPLRTYLGGIGPGHPILEDPAELTDRMLALAAPHGIDPLAAEGIALRHTLAPIGLVAVLIAERTAGLGAISDAAIVAAVEPWVEPNREHALPPALVTRYRDAVLGSLSVATDMYDRLGLASVVRAAYLDPAASLVMLRQRRRGIPRRTGNECRVCIEVGIAVAAGRLDRRQTARAALGEAIALCQSFDMEDVEREVRRWSPGVLEDVAGQRRDGKSE